MSTSSGEKNISFFHKIENLFFHEVNNHQKLSFRDLQISLKNSESQQNEVTLSIILGGTTFVGKLYWFGFVRILEKKRRKKYFL